VVSLPYGEYDAQLGVTYQPNTSYSPVIMRNGSIAACLGEVSSANQDSFRGRTTLAEYGNAEVKLVVVGDSFSHWKQEGLTWPDLLQERLRVRLDRPVAVIDLAAGGYGILQMVDAAAWVANEYRPDAIIIAFISDDLTRARWWKRNERIDGFLRSLLSPDKWNLSLAIAKDELINSAATDDWCARNVGNDNAPGLAGVVDQYRRVAESLWKARGKSPPSFWDMSESVVLRKVLGGKVREQVTYSLPRIRFASFREDPRFVDGVERLKRFG
jgi:hypothetical protein